MPRTRTKPARADADPVAADRLPPPRKTPVPLPKGWKRAADALERIESVSTIFPDFNRASRCGGLPVKRMHTIHGPTHGGKTAFVLGLVKSFLDGGHVAAYVDAEQSTPQEFAAELMGDLEQRENFFGKRPENYEDTMNAIDELLDMMTLRRKHEPSLYCIAVIDSINKLQPKRELKNVLKAGGEEISKGHAGRYRAAVNQAWLNHLSPRLGPAGCAMVFIAQERDDATADPWAPDGGVQIKGGQALSFDASMLIRVSKSMPMRDTSTATEKSKGEIVGFAHRVRIYKSKVSHMDGAYTECTYHFSNGKQTPPGFDTARDAIHVARKLDLVKLSGSWLSWRKTRWQGELRAASALASKPELLHGLLHEIEQRLERDRARVRGS